MSHTGGMAKRSNAAGMSRFLHESRSYFCSDANCSHLEINHSIPPEWRAKIRLQLALFFCSVGQSGDETQFSITQWLIDLSEETARAPKTAIIG